MQKNKSNSSVNLSIQKWKSGEWQDQTDALAAEEPLEIRLGQHGDNAQPVSITMRTPGHDAELALGFLLTEGLLHTTEQIDKWNQPETNAIEVVLRPGVSLELEKLKRNFYTTSSCGVCGKASIDAIRTVHSKPEQVPLQVSPEILSKLPIALRNAQSVFEQTGGLHASALFTASGQLIQLREDVGRHNALDKLIGWAWMEDILPLNQAILLLSGRASFELVQKAAAAQIQVIAAIGAPSSLAVQLAQEFGITLVGFLKEQSMNVYSGSERIRVGRMGMI